MEMFAPIQPMVKLFNYRAISAKMYTIPLLSGRSLQRRILKFMGVKAVRERYTKFTAATESPPWRLMAVFKISTYL